MRSSITGGVAAVLVLVVLILGYQSLFEVQQGMQALVLRFGQPVKVITQPCKGDAPGASPAQSHCAGLYAKWPLWIENVVYISARILDLENPAQEVIASDQKRLVVDAFARYRIQEPLRFYQTVGSIAVANSQLSTLLNSALRRVLGEATLTQVVRDERPQLMSKVRDQLDREARQFGIAVIDVRMRRADLPEQNSQAVYQRMQTERQREAAEFRAQGNQRAAEIKARADREVTVLVAEATSKAEQTRGAGDAERNRIFAEAYGKDPGFFSFYRSMQAYEASLRPNDTRLVVKPDSDFFRYFGDPSGKSRDSADAGKDASKSAPDASKDANKTGADASKN
jgi:modulator of FtsH protease HflC